MNIECTPQVIWLLNDYSFQQGSIPANTRFEINPVADGAISVPFLLPFMWSRVAYTNYSACNTNIGEGNLLNLFALFNPNPDSLLKINRELSRRSESLSLLLQDYRLRTGHQVHLPRYLGVSSFGYEPRNNPGNFKGLLYAILIAAHNIPR